MYSFGIYEYLLNWIKICKCLLSFLFYVGFKSMCLRKMLELSIVFVFKVFLIMILFNCLCVIIGRCIRFLFLIVLGYYLWKRCFVIRRGFSVMMVVLVTLLFFTGLLLCWMFWFVIYLDLIVIIVFDGV